MQQRRRRRFALPILLAVLLAGGTAFLMIKDVPAPRQTIEKPLDTARLLKE